MAITRAQLLERLDRSGLLPTEEVAKLRDQMSSQQAGLDGPTLAAELVKNQHLTLFQAEALAAEEPIRFVFGDYLVCDKLGEGGMGVVFKARDRRKNRVVALKILHPAVVKSEDAVKRFRREVEVTTRLSHPNIVAALDANQVEGIPYLVMEYVEGNDLFRLVKEQGTLTPNCAIEYILQAAQALEHAHEHGIVHRDVKPSNLLLDSSGTVKILDMGLVRCTDQDYPGGDGTGDNLTQTGEILGSFDYMAPEQAIDTKSVDLRADIYSLGCTLFYLLSARAPYRGETSMQKLLAHRENSIPSLRHAQADIPLALDAVFHRMMAKKPEDRYISMRELIRDLEACRQMQAVLSGAGSDSSLGEPSFRLVPSQLIVAGTACIVAVIAGNTFLVREAQANQWHLNDDPIYVKWYVLFAGVGLFAGIGMVAIGTFMTVLAALAARLSFGSGARARRHPGRLARSAARWLLGVLAGVAFGALAGAVIGAGLATHPREEVRVAGGIVLGALAALSLAGWRAWPLILAGMVAGFFVGSTIGPQGFSLRYFGRTHQMPGDNLGMLGFGIAGALLGAVLGARMASRKRPDAPQLPHNRVPVFIAAGVDNEDPELAANETIRRAPRRE